MRGVLLAVLVAVVGGGVAGQEKKVEPKYDSVKELDKKAKDALTELKKRGDGHVDKGIVAFGEVVNRADPASTAAQRVAGQAAFFLHKLYDIKEAAAVKEYQATKTDEATKELARIRAEQELWHKAGRTAAQDRPALTKAWEAIQREWALEDLKKK